MKLLCEVAMNLLIKLQNVAWEQTLLFLWIISPSKFITWQQLIWHAACLAGAWICPLDIKKSPYQCHSAGMKWDGHKSKNLHLYWTLDMVFFISLLFVTLFEVQQSILTAWMNKQQYIHFAIRSQTKTSPLQQTHISLQVVWLPFRELLTLRGKISLGKCLEDGQRNKMCKQDLSQSFRGYQQKQHAPVSCEFTVLSSSCLPRLMAFGLDTRFPTLRDTWSKRKERINPQTSFTETLSARKYPGSVSMKSS